MLHEGDAAVTGKGYDEARGALAIAKAKAFLDSALPLDGASYADLAGLAIVSGKVEAKLSGGHSVGLAEPKAFVGHAGHASEPKAVLLRHNGLGIEMGLDRATPVPGTRRCLVSGVGKLAIPRLRTLVSRCPVS